MSLLWFALMIAQNTLAGQLPMPQTGPWSDSYSVTIKAAWLDPGPGQAYWMVPTACLVLLIPAFFMTVLVESFIYRRAFAPHAATLDPMRATWRMHCFSYGFLAVAGLFLLAASVVKHDRIQRARHAPHRAPSEAPGRQTDR